MWACDAGPSVPGTGVPIATGGPAPWGEVFSGTGTNQGLAVAVSADGSSVVAGTFEGSARFSDTEARIARGFQPEMFLARFDVDGALVWLRTFGFPGEARPHALAIDPADDGIVVVGEVRGQVNFGVLPPVGAHQPAGETDAFVLRLSPEGESVWMMLAGGAGVDTATAVAIDDRGFVYVAGSFEGLANFHPDPVIGDLQRAVAGRDAFVLKLSRDRRYVWTRLLSGSGDVVIHDLRFAADRHLLLAGQFSGSIDFNPSGFADPRFATSSFGDGFVARLLPEGQLVWVHTFGNPMGATLATSVDADPSGVVFATGTFSGLTDFGTGLTRSPLGLTDAFLLRLERTGAPSTVRRLGASEQVGIPSLRVDGATVVLGGSFAQTLEMQPGIGQPLPAPRATLEGYVAAFDLQLRTRSLFTFGGAGEVRVRRLGLGPAGERLVVGDFLGTLDLPTTAVFDRRSAVGGSDAFLLRVR